MVVHCTMYNVNVGSAEYAKRLPGNAMNFSISNRFLIITRA